MSAPDREFLCENQGVRSDGDAARRMVADFGAFISLVGA